MAGSYIVNSEALIFKSGISFALNNDPEVQDSCKVRIITAEMSYGNSPWHS